MTPEQIGIAIANRFMSGKYTGRDNLAMHITSAINEERERCAKMVDEFNENPDWPDWPWTQCAAAIRKGG